MVLSEHRGYQPHLSYFLLVLSVTWLFIVISVRFESHLLIDDDLWSFYAWKTI